MVHNKIYTPQTLYSDFVPNLNLRDSVVSDERVDDVVYNEVYFNGRATAEGRVLVYGIYARHTDGKKHNAILIIPDYKSGLDINVINLYVKLGYDVLMFDYKGECEGTDNFTHYPSDIKYANLVHAGRHLDYVDTDARETCWYEWACVAAYGVTFLRSRIETNKIGVLGIKNGANIMWHLIAFDPRVTCAVALFGAGWRAYRNIRKYGDRIASRFEVDDERIRFLAGIDAHAFAPSCRCPVALFTSTNSAEFDADRAHDTIRRVNPRVDSFFCLAPRMSEEINLNCTRNIELFFGIYLNGQRIQKLDEPIVNIRVNGELAEIDILTDEEAKPRNVEIFVCESQNVPSRRNWHKIEDVQKLSDTSYLGTYNLINGGEVLFAFAVVEYRNGITVSSPITMRKCPKTQVIKTNLIYSSDAGIGDFTYHVSGRDRIADAVFYKRSPIEIVKGPMGINGISSKTGLVSYKLNENCVDIRQDSIIKLDLYCSSEVTFNVLMFTEAGTENEKIYNVSVDVPKGEVWQNVILVVKDFKTKEGFPIPVSDYDLIDRLVFMANGEFSVNNVLII